MFSKHAGPICLARTSPTIYCITVTADSSKTCCEGLYLPVLAQKHYHWQPLSSRSQQGPGSEMMKAHESLSSFSNIGTKG